MRLFPSKDQEQRNHAAANPQISEQQGLEIQVVFTGRAASRAALKLANNYARGLDARFRIIATLVVPYPLPLTDRLNSCRMLERELAALACGQATDAAETAVQIYICRDADQTIREVLHRESTTVVGGYKRWWWPTREQRLACRLRRDGHRVIFLNVKSA